MNMLIKNSVQICGRKVFVMVWWLNMVWWFDGKSSLSTILVVKKTDANQLDTNSGDALRRRAVEQRYLYGKLVADVTTLAVTG